MRGTDEVKEVLFSYLDLCVPLGHGRRVDQASFAAHRVGLTPKIDARSTYPETPASPRDVTDLHWVWQYPQLALNIVLLRDHPVLERAANRGDSGFLVEIAIDLGRLIAARS